MNVSTGFRQCSIGELMALDVLVMSYVPMARSEYSRNAIKSTMSSTAETCYQFSSTSIDQESLLHLTQSLAETYILIIPDHSHYTSSSPKYHHCNTFARLNSSPTASKKAHHALHHHNPPLPPPSPHQSHPPRVPSSRRHRPVRRVSKRHRPYRRLRLRPPALERPKRRPLPGLPRQPTRHLRPRHHQLEMCQQQWGDGHLVHGSDDLFGQSDSEYRLGGHAAAYPRRRMLVGALR